MTKYFTHHDQLESYVKKKINDRSFGLFQLYLCTCQKWPKENVVGNEATGTW